MANQTPFPAATRKPDQPAGPRISTLELKLRPLAANSVAPDEQNTIAQRIVRLPIGWHTVMPETKILFQVYIPTNSGGLLHLRISDGGTVDLRRSPKKVIEKAAGDVFYEVPRQTHGNFYVLAKGPKNARVECYFDQVSFARDGVGDNDKPLLPWQFWYWPFSGPDPDRAAEVLARYAKAVGKDVSKAKAWELKEHKKVKPENWEGHCTFAAEASMKFKLPNEKRVGKQKFTRAEIKLLAAEYCGNYLEGSMEEAWKPEPKSLMDPHLIGFHSFLQIVKPGEPFTFKQLTKRVDQALPDASFRKKENINLEKRIQNAKKKGASNAKGSDLGLDSGLAMLKYKEPEAYVEDGFGTKNSTQISQELRGKFGVAAANFYQTLIEYMRIDKHPLFSDMRSYSESDGPRPVWNQVYFYYNAQYQERAVARETGTKKKGEPMGPQDIDITCDLFSNDDKPGHKPVAVVSKKRFWWVDPYPQGRSNNMQYKMAWCLHFAPDGTIVPNHSNNAWRYVRNRDNKNLFIPNQLLYGTKEFAAEQTKKPYKGNPTVGHELLKRRFVRRNLRYR